MFSTPVTLTRPDGSAVSDQWGTFELGAGCVQRIRFGGSGGYGDPLERDPELVARDVALGYVSVERALAAYGVALDALADEHAKPAKGA